MKKIFVAIAAIIVAFSFTFLSACANKSDVNDNYNNDQVPPADTGEETPENPTDDGEGDGEDEESSVKLSEDEWRAAVEASVQSDNFSSSFRVTTMDGLTENVTYNLTRQLVYCEIGTHYGSEDTENGVNNYHAITEQYYVIGDDGECDIWFTKNVSSDGTDSGWVSHSSAVEGVRPAWQVLNMLMSYGSINYITDGQELKQFAELYDYMQFDSFAGIYSGTFDLCLGERVIMPDTLLSLAIKDGYISSLTVQTIVDGVSSDAEINFSSYGSTVVTLPDELQAML